MFQTKFGKHKLRCAFSRLLDSEWRSDASGFFRTPFSYHFCVIFLCDTKLHHGTHAQTILSRDESFHMREHPRDVSDHQVLTIHHNKDSLVAPIIDASVSLWCRLRFQFRVPFSKIRRLHHGMRVYSNVRFPSSTHDASFPIIFDTALGVLGRHVLFNI